MFQQYPYYLNIVSMLIKHKTMTTCNRKQVVPSHRVLQSIPGTIHQYTCVVPPWRCMHSARSEVTCMSMGGMRNTNNSYRDEYRCPLPLSQHIPYIYHGVILDYWEARVPVGRVISFNIFTQFVVGPKEKVCFGYRTLPSKIFIQFFLQTLIFLRFWA